MRSVGFLKEWWCLGSVPSCFEVPPRGPSLHFPNKTTNQCAEGMYYIKYGPNFGSSSPVFLKTTSPIFCDWQCEVGYKEKRHMEG